VTIRCGCPATVDSERRHHYFRPPAVRHRSLASRWRRIEFTLLENDWVELRSGNTQYKIVALPKENFPSIPEAAPATAMIPEHYLEA